MSNSAGSRSGNGYWQLQIGSTGLLGGGCIVASIILWETSPDEPGRAVLVALLGILFLTTFGWAIDAATRSTRQERALFAWAIAQHEAAGHGSDARALHDAARARDGKIGPTQIRVLQAFRPDNPYPGDLSPADAPSDGTNSKSDTAKNRIRIALVALFLALTGLYLSCLPAVFVLGWPFQFVASILSVLAIVKPGRGRRLGIAAAGVSVLGTVVTVVMIVWRVVAAAG